MNSSSGTALCGCKAKQLSCPTSEESLSHCIWHQRSPECPTVPPSPWLGSSAHRDPSTSALPTFPSASQTPVISLQIGLGTMSGTLCPSWHCSSGCCQPHPPRLSPQPVSAAGAWTSCHAGWRVTLTPLHFLTFALP